MPTYNPAMQKARLPDAAADAHGLISKKTAPLDGVAVTEVTFRAGARWSTDLKPHAGTDLCELPHVALVTAGTLRVALNDGSQEISRLAMSCSFPLATMPGRSVMRHVPSSSSPGATTTTPKAADPCR